MRFAHIQSSPASRLAATRANHTMRFLPLLFLLLGLFAVGMVHRHANDAGNVALSITALLSGSLWGMIVAVTMGRQRERK